MSPIDDPRRFCEVLADWMGRNNLSAYAVAKMIGARQGFTVTGWLGGKPATFEPALRAFMALVDARRGVSRVK